MTRATLEKYFIARSSSSGLKISSVLPHISDLPFETTGGIAIILCTCNTIIIN